MTKFALIKNLTVLNVIEAQEEFIESLVNSDVIDFGVDVTGVTTPIEIGDHYDDGVFSTSLSKPQAIARRRVEFLTELRAWRDTRYDQETRENFRTIYLIATEDGLTNRKAYVRQLFDWATQVIEFSLATITALQSQPTAASVLAYQWDFTAIDVADPHITLLGAISIPD